MRPSPAPLPERVPEGRRWALAIATARAGQHTVETGSRQPFLIVRGFPHNLDEVPANYAIANKSWSITIKVDRIG
jgi:hypothetical protein